MKLSNRSDAISLIPLLCFILLHGQAHAAGTFYTNESLFQSAVTSANILLDTESFESLPPALPAPFTIDDITVSKIGGSFVGVSTSFPTDGIRSIGWEGSGGGPITFTFASPVNAFGIDIRDFGTYGLTDLAMTTSTGGTLLYNDFFGGSGNLLFGGYIDPNQTFTSVTFNSNSTSDAAFFDSVFFDSLQFGFVAPPILVDPEFAGATDVIAEFSGIPTLLTNPVASPLNVDRLDVGNTGNGALLVSSDGVINSNGSIVIGDFAGSNGTLEVRGGTITTDAAFLISDQGTGTLRLNQGANVTAGRFGIGANMPGTGTATISGAGTVLTTDDISTAPEFSIGSVGDGSLTIEAGARVTIVDTDASSTSGSGIGRISGSTGNVTVTGSGSLLELGKDLSLGGTQTTSGGTGTLTIQERGSVTVAETFKLWGGGTLTLQGNTDPNAPYDPNDGGSLTVGSLDNSNGGTINHLDGTLTIDGGTYDIAASVLKVGSTSGIPQLNYINGASSTEQLLRIATLPNEKGSVELTGIGSSITTTGDVDVADEFDSQGSLTVASGALVSVGDDLAVGNGGGAGTVNIDPNGTINVVDETLVGRRDGGAASFLNIDNGIFNGENRFTVARDPNSTGHVTVSGAKAELNVGKNSGVGNLEVGRDGLGTMTVQTGATVTAAVDLKLGRNSTGNGTLNISDPNSQVLVDGSAFVGDSGTGILNITNGGSLTNVEARIGNASTATGTATVDGTDPNGNASTWTSTGSLFVGSSGIGTLNVTGSGVVDVADDIRIGDALNSSGTINVGDATLNVASELQVGYRGEGNMTIGVGADIDVASFILVGIRDGGDGGDVQQTGGQVTVPDLVLGYDANVVGNYDISDGNLAVTDDLIIGRQGTGTMGITGGTVTVSDQVLIGRDVGSDGTLAITGGSFNANGDVIVGNSGTGTLTVSGNSLFNASDIRVGENVGSLGNFTVDNSTITLGDEFVVGNNGSVTIDPNTEITVSRQFLVGTGNGVNTGNVQQSGGMISVPDVKLGFDPNSSGSYTISGGTLDASGVFVVGRAGNGTLNFTGGNVNVGFLESGVLADSNGDITVNGTGTILHSSGVFAIGGNSTANGGSGSLTIENSGHVEVIGTTRLWSGDDSLLVNGGSLTTGSLIVDPNANLGLEDGTITINGGTFDNGSSSLVIGASSGDPVMRFVNGATTTVPSIELGGVSTIGGQIDVEGNGSTVTTTGSFSVVPFNTSQGTLNVANGGHVDIGDDLIVGDNFGEGTVNIDPNGTITVADETTIGIMSGAVSNLNITNGMFDGQDDLTVARDSGSEGHVTVSGADAQLDVGSTIDVGRNGLGTMTAQGGATVTGAADLYLGQNFAGFGTLTLSDPNTQVTVVGSVYVGDIGTGAINIMSGGSLSSNDGVIASQDGSTGSVTIDGIGSSWTNTGGLFIGNGGNGNLSIANGGSVSSANATIVGSDQNGFASLAVYGAGSSLTSSSTIIVGNSTDSQGLMTVTDGGTVSSSQGSIGVSFLSSGFAEVNGPGSTWSNTNELTVGLDGTGTLSIDTGGKVSNVDGLIGRSSTGIGAVDVNDPNSVWTNTGNLEIGGYLGSATGAGTLAILNSGHVEVAGNTRLYDGNDTLTVDGGSLTTGSLTIDPNATFEHLDGTITIDGGDFDNGGNGLVISSASGNPLMRFTDGPTVPLNIPNLIVGEGPGESGSLEFDDGFYVVSQDPIYVIGDQGNGTMSIINGAIIFPSGSPSGGFIGRQAGATGHVLVDGSNSRWDPGDLNLGGDTGSTGGVGTLTIQNGGFINAGTTTLWGSGDIVTIDGGRLRTFAINNAGGGTLDFVSGTLEVYGAAEQLIVTTSGASIGNQPLDTATAFSSLHTIELAGQVVVTPGATLSMTGGSLETSNFVLSAGAILDYDSGTVSGPFQGAIGSRIDLNVNDMSLGDASAVNGFGTAGTVNVRGNTLTLLDANDAVFDSLANVNIGLFSTPGTINAANGLTLDFGGNITGYGTVDTPNSAATPLINNGHIASDDPNELITLTGYVKGVGTLDNVLITGTDAPGFSPAKVNRGSVVYDGVLEIELGGTSSGSFDQINHILGAGIADLGGVLDVQLINGFVPNAGDFFEIITASSVLDLFDTELLPALGGGLSWLIDYQPTSVLLSVEAGLAGDFNNDGQVDGFDFLAWQRDPGLGSLSDWEANYGTSINANATTVPEPSTVLLLMLGSVVLVNRRRYC